MQRRHFSFGGIATLAGLGATTGTAQAQTGWSPNRALKLIVSAAPGSPPDITARPLAEQLAASLGQSVLVENRPGAGGIIGMETLLRSAPDGHTIG